MRSKSNAARRAPKKSHAAKSSKEKAIIKTQNDHTRLFCEATSRELSTALAALVGELDYAFSTTNGIVRARSMAIALTAADKALTLSKNLRYFTLHTKLDKKWVDLAQLVLDTIDLLEKDWKHKQIEIDVHVEDGSYAYVDANSIQQILFSLFSNAVKAVPAAGKIQIELRLDRKRKEYIFRCRDNGKGIQANQLKNIFKPYSQNHSVTAHGLGLFVAKTLIERHAGELKLTSQENIGTEVAWNLPLEETENLPAVTKRRSTRVMIQLPAILKLSENAPYRTEISVLGKNGCFVSIANPGEISLPEIGAPLTLEVFHFGKESFQIPDAKVANVCWTSQNAGIGVEFGKLDAKAMTLLAALLKSHEY